MSGSLVILSTFMNHLGWPHMIVGHMAKIARTGLGTSNPKYKA